MPNHIHLLASPSDAIGMSRMMQWIGRQYVPYFNKKYQRTGTLWEGRFRATVIESEQYFLICSRYIELNPVRANMTSDVSEYRWSSYAHHAGIKAESLITDHALYWALGNTPFEREIAYKAIISEGVANEEVEAITEATIKGWALGSDKFKEQIGKCTDRRVEPGKRGRPARKEAASSGLDKSDELSGN